MANNPESLKGIRWIMKILGWDVDSRKQVMRRENNNKNNDNDDERKH